MADYTQIKFDVADNIATITLDRPEKMNAYTRVMMAEIMVLIMMVMMMTTVAMAMIVMV